MKFNSRHESKLQDGFLLKLDCISGLAESSGAMDAPCGIVLNRTALMPGYAVLAGGYCENCPQPPAGRKAQQLTRPIIENPRPQSGVQNHHSMPPMPFRTKPGQCSRHGPVFASSISLRGAAAAHSWPEFSDAKPPPKISET